MPNEPATEAITAFNALVAGITFPVITDNLADASFNLPAQTGFLYETPAALTVEKLTDTTVGGDGVFDKIMTSLRNHLIEEFDNNRITGREYAEVYQALTATALQNAVQFAITADATAYQNALVQMQARTAEAQALSARVDVIRAKYAIVSAIAESENMKANYALTKMQIAVQDINYSQVEQQVILTTNQAASVISEKNTIDYRLAHILPEEKRRLVYETDHVLTTNVEKTDKEIVILGSQNLQTIAETARINNQTILTASQNLQVLAEIDTIEYRLANILPEEKRELISKIDNIMTKEAAKLNYETTVLMVDQHNSLVKDLAIKTYQEQHILPSQKNLMVEQYEVQRAQTMDTRSNGITTVTGAIGKQKELYTEQISSYTKDARLKAAKFWLDGWITQKGLDEGLLAPAQLTNAEIDEVLVSIKTNLGLGS